MDVNQINAYLERAQEIIGDRTEAEIAFDDTVIAHLTGGKDIKRAIRAANPEHPTEALHPDADSWADLAAHYEYLKKHKAILKGLGMKE